MLTWLNHRFFGYLFVEMTGFSPERFLNMCSVHEIEVWEVFHSGHTYRFFMTVPGFRKIKPLVRKSKVRLRILKKFGLPFFLYRNRKRKYYAAGFLCFLMMLYALSLFIWDIQFDGNQMYTYDTLLKFCESEEIRYGMKKSKINCDVLEESLRTRFPEITWVSARVSGTRLLVKIKENEVLFEIPVKDETPCDLIAQKDGTITSMIVRSGVPMVKVGDEVSAGQVLVSGTLPVIGDSEEIMNTHYVHSDGDITARTEYHYNRKIPLFKTIDVETGKVRRGRYIKAFQFSFLFMRPRPDGTAWKQTMEEKQLHLFENFYLPIYVGKITGNEYISYERPYTEEEKKELADQMNQSFQKKLLEKGVQILENHVKILDNESLCQISMDYVTEEPLGRQEALKMQTTEEPEETNNSNERN
ncbi:sporulation protein YqfD [Clostridium boliviensis]|uniref:Sporulation protein YqfD n=1 Tax=Clostridium boliviensis TaxID=318465 RepID=A0ABU4GPL3_9CLOT|nr:sporulation protein YqfD [Clostridium boliviensis]MDW2799562.1 sporulation protein YqfD [Clostridium boliviensis]